MNLSPAGPLSAMQTLQSKAADALRGLTPQLLADLRSFGQFHLPDMDGGQTSSGHLDLLKNAEDICSIFLLVYSP